MRTARFRRCRVCFSCILNSYLGYLIRAASSPTTTASFHDHAIFDFPIADHDRIHCSRACRSPITTGSMDLESSSWEFLTRILMHDHDRRPRPSVILYDDHDRRPRSSAVPGDDHDRRPRSLPFLITTTIDDHDRDHLVTTTIEDHAP